MGLFRKKIVEITAATIDTSTTLGSVVTSSEIVAEEARSFTAAELQPFVTKAVRTYGTDGRQYLILGDNVGRDGRAPEWEFHVLFPTLKAEGIWRLERSDDGLSSVLVGRLSPVPTPGTTEYLMAQLSPQLQVEQEKAWDLRLQLLVALPTEFADSPDVVEAIEALQPNVFASGPLRLKARTPPNGGPVWEWKGSDLVHVPFTFAPEEEPLVSASATAE